MIPKKLSQDSLALFNGVLIKAIVETTYVLFNSVKIINQKSEVNYGLVNWSQ